LEVISKEQQQEQKNNNNNNNNNNKSSLTAAHTPSCFNHIHSNIIDRKFTISLQLPKMFTLNIIRVFYVY
jgi:2-C-methyl-D-erythritol 4-phosphate cytidylyltransferase